MAKNNRNLIICIVVAVVVIVAIIIGVIIGNSGNNAGESGDSGQVDGTSKMDYSNASVSIDYGDYEGMYTLSKSIQNGEITGEIVKIDGKVSHSLTRYSIVEEGEDGNGIGTEFVIEGIEEEEYPQDGARVVISGEIYEKEPLYFVIKTTPEYVDVLELTEEETTKVEE